MTNPSLLRPMMIAKIHRATVTETNTEYIGSIVIDQDLLRAADIWPGEKVLISDIDNAARFETYAVEGKAGSGQIMVNGAAAKLVNKGDKIIIMAFEYSDVPVEAKTILVDEKNRYVKRL